MSDSSVVENKSTSHEKRRIIRRLGHFERLMDAWTYCEHYCGTTVTCRYTIPSELAGSEQHQKLVGEFENVIAKTILEHPLLQVGLAGKTSKKMAFVALDSVDMTHHVSWRVVEPTEDYEAGLQDHIRRSLDTKFTSMETRPAWKISIFRPRGVDYLDLVFLFNHTIGDGAGAKILQESFLRALNTPAEGTVPEMSGHILKLPKQPREYYTPPLDKMCKMPLTKRYTISQAWESLRPPFLVSKSDTQAHWMPYRPGPAYTQRRTVFVEGDKMESVLKACRAHGTTVTGLLQAMAIVSLARQVQKEDAPAFRANTAIDLRRFVPDKQPGTDRKQSPFSTFGNLVTSMDHDYSTQLIADIRNCTASSLEAENLPEIEKIVWTVAVQVGKELKARLEKGLKNEIIAMCKYVGDWREELNQWAKKPREVSLHVSNVRVIDGTAEDGQWKITRAMFSMSAETGGPVASLSAMTVKGGVMCVDVTWQDGTIDNSMGERMAKELREWFKDFALRA